MKLYIKYTFTMPEGTISETGIDLIQRYVTCQNPSEGEWKKLNPEYNRSLLPQIPLGFEWKWMITEGEYVGKFAKRVSAFYYKKHNLKCPDSFLEHIGNLARSHSSDNKTYAFEFVNEFDWDAGDFGDDNSCFWGDNAGALFMLKDNGAMAIRFYDENEEGFARAWLVELDSSLYIIFNGYGIPGDATLVIARIFAAFMNLRYKQIYLKNSWGHTLYINSSQGYIIGTIEEIEHVERHDFEWADVHAETCYSCGRVLDEYDIYWGADDSAYCERCYSDYFTSCYECGETRYTEDLTYVESAEADVCDWCLRRKFTQCPRCDEFYRSNIMERFGDRLYCEECAEELKIEGDNIE